MVQLQHVSPDGRRIASLDAEPPEILITGETGRELERVSLGELHGISGLHWLASGGGLAVWTLDQVHVVGLDGHRELAFSIDQPGGRPLSVEDVRVLPHGLLVVSQACGGGRVRRQATVVHLDDAHVVGDTDLRAWSGAFLYAATALRDGRIVLSLNEPEHLEVAQQQCVRQAAAHGDSSTAGFACWYMTQHTRFFASEFRVLRVHRPGVVEIQGSHACPRDDGCMVQNWAPSATEIVWTDPWRTYRLLSPPSPSPLMPEGGVWAAWDTVPKYYWTPVHSLWMERGRVLHASREHVWTADPDGRLLRTWTWPDSGPVKVLSPRRVRTSNDVEPPRHNEVFAVRFTPDGRRALVALAQRIVELDLDGNDEQTVFEMIDVPSAFDPHNHGLHFGDAKRSRSGVLAFDVVRLEEPRKGIFSVEVGRAHDGCRRDFADDSRFVDLEVSQERHRELLPFVRKRTRPW